MFSLRSRILLLLLWTVLEGFAVASSARAYVLNGYHWPAGTEITMHLQLERTPVPLQDGFGSWNASAADALAIWNQSISTVHFAQAGPSSATGGDGINAVFFSNSIYGESFGSHVLAVTLYYSHSGFGIFSETDVIFNNARTWNSYRGAQQGSGATATYDLHRVALHEFGHALGLDHPDENGQPGVEAIMNSIISNLDHLAEDDIAGALSLYGLHITSPEYQQFAISGNQFSYQVTAANNPTSYSATGLPPGLQINPLTGLISGTCTTSGSFTVNILVQGSLGEAVGRFVLFIQPLSLTSPPPAGNVLQGDHFSYQITAANNPTSFSATSLPPGITLNAATGLISGVATTLGNYYVTLTARSSTSEATGTISINVVTPQITSYSAPALDIGSPFSYQITANNRPTSFEAVGLPASLHLNAVTGEITGIVTLSGTFPITLKAHGFGDASANLNIDVRPLEVETAASAALTIGSYSRPVSDPARNRIYLISTGYVSIIDANSLAVLKTVNFPSTFYSTAPGFSTDHKTLWLPGYYSAAISRLNLETLTALPDVATALLPQAVQEGADGHLYVKDFNSPGIFQLDRGSGATLATFAPTSLISTSARAIDVSPDHRTLYSSETGSTVQLVKFDIASPTSPVELQRTTVPANTYIASIAVSPDGQALVHTVAPDFSQGGATSVRSTANLNQIRTTLQSSANGLESVFSTDGTLLFQTGVHQTSVRVFNANTGALVRTLVLPEQARVESELSLAVGGTPSRLFVAAVSGSTGARLYVFPVVPPPAPPTPSKTLLNVATRLSSKTGDDVLIGGFIVQGSQAKKIILRADGPSLPVAGHLNDPILELHRSDGHLIAQNDNWNEHRADVIASSVPPTEEHESAIVATLQPGAYTAVVRGLGDTTGVALFELFDLEPNSNSRIANISTRGKVETGDNVMIGGFIIGGNQPTKVIVKAVGPSLSDRGVAGALPDTTLELHNGNGVLFASNDDWQSDQAAEITASTVAPTDPRESAIVRTLQPGNYTAIVRGKNDTTGVALVEVYNLEPH